jgi:hypothetical protein
VPTPKVRMPVQCIVVMSFDIVEGILHIYLFIYLLLVIGNTTRTAHLKVFYIDIHVYLGCPSRT